MADASAKRARDMQSTLPPSHVPAHLSGGSRTPCEKTENGDCKTIPTNRMPSGSPLRTVDTNRSPATRRRPHPSTTASIASRTSSLPTTPLDEIPAELWPRFFRMATTPEMSNPELSIDEITSTRLSHDDQLILSNLPREANQEEAQSRRVLMRTTFGSMWGENSGRLKKMTKKLRKMPSGLFNRRGRRAEEALTPTTTQTTSSTEPSLPPLEITTELYVPAARTSSNSARSATNKPLTSTTDSDCQPTEAELRDRELAKISHIIRKDVHEARNRDRILPPSRSGIPDRVPRHFLGAPTYRNMAAASVMDPTYIAMDQLLHGPRSRKTVSYGDDSRAPSIGSVEELRTHAFGNRRGSRPSLSGFSSMQGSAPSITRTSYSTPRPATHSGSISSVSATLVPPTPQLFMDAPNASSDSLWRVPTPQKRPLTLSAERPMSKGSTLRNGRVSSSTTTRTISSPIAQIGVGFGDLPEYNKLPLCVPRRVEPTKRHGEPERRGRDVAEDEDGPSESRDAMLSTPPSSDKSFESLSLRGQTSVHSNLERHAMLQEQVEESNPAAYYWDS